VYALLDSGIVEKNDRGKLFVPYANIDFDLAIGGFISGTIFDSSSVAITGVADIRIEAFTVISAGAPCGQREFAGWANIDSNTGKHTITGLPARDFYLVTRTGYNFYIDQYYDTDPATDGISCSHTTLIMMAGFPWWKFFISWGKNTSSLQAVILPNA